MTNVVHLPGPPPGESMVPIIRTKFLAPDRLRRKLRPAMELCYRGSAKTALLNPNRPDHSAPVARKWLAEIPDTVFLRNACTIFDEAMEKPAEPIELTLAVAWMVDAYPNRGASVGPNYVETVELLLAEADETLSIAAVASGMRELIQASKFLPVTAEVLEAAEKGRLRFWGAKNRAEHLIQMRWSAEDVLQAIGELPAPPDLSEPPF